MSDKPTSVWAIDACVDCGKAKLRKLILPRSHTCHDCAWRSLEANRRWAAAMERDALAGWV